MYFIGFALLLSLIFGSGQSMRMAMQNTISEDAPPDNEADLRWIKLDILNNPPEKRRGHTSIVVGNELLVFGGCYLDQKCFNDLHAFDTESKSWSSQKINGIPPTPREGHTATLVGSKVYLFGGSGSSSYYNDLYIFDLETKTWVGVNFPGPKPSPRANHGAVVDKKGRILIFGGFTENGYSNEVYILDPVEERWEKPFISGQAPIPRENFSMTKVRNTVWIFGGFTDGGVLGDLSILDLESMSWNVVETFGTKPPGRQGHSAILHEQNLIIFGGCNYKINTCFSDTYYLDIDSLWWKKINDEKTKDFTSRESFSANVVGPIIYVFGGCQMYEKCYDDILIYNTNIPCPNACSKNGECRNNRCVCYQGFFDNDCSLVMKCKDDCNNHGQCRTNGKCACYPGFVGEGCDIMVGCPQNCTSPDRGVCLSTGVCQCFPSFSGNACDVGHATELSCPRGCSHHGECDTKTGICICEKYYTGDDCSKKFYEANLDEAKAETRIRELRDDAAEERTIDKVREAIEEQQKLQENEEGEEGETENEEEKRDEGGEEEREQGEEGEQEEEREVEEEKEEGSQEQESGQEEQQENEMEEQAPPVEAEEQAPTEEEIQEEIKEVPQTEETESQNYEESYRIEDEVPKSQEPGTVEEYPIAEEEPPKEYMTTPEEEIDYGPPPEENAPQQQEIATTEEGYESSPEIYPEREFEERPPPPFVDEKIETFSKPTQKKDGKVSREALEQQLEGDKKDKASKRVAAQSATVEQNAIQTLTPEMFAEAFASEKKLQDKKVRQSILDNISDCPNSCSYNGICRNSVCYCSNGYTGDDCSVSNAQDLKSGETVDKLLKYAAVCFVLGLIIGIFVIVALIRKAKESEYMNIEQKEEEEEEED